RPPRHRESGVEDPRLTRRTTRACVVRRRTRGSTYPYFGTVNLVESIKIDEALMIPPGRHALPADAVGQRQRERLLRAMVACVGREGYKETTIADVVATAR